MFFNGQPPDYEKARWCFNMAAQKGDADARFKLGLIYYKALGVDQNFEIARHYFELAEGHVDAQFKLGLIYYKGSGSVDRHYEQARQNFGKTAKRGHPKAQYNLDLIYYKGHGASQDYEQAKHYFEMAANQSDACAQYMLGRMFQKGNGVNICERKAKLYYEMAAKQDHSLAKQKRDFLSKRKKFSSSKIYSWFKRS